MTSTAFQERFWGRVNRISKRGLGNFSLSSDETNGSSRKFPKNVPWNQKHTTIDSSNMIHRISKSKSPSMDPRILLPRKEEPLISLSTDQSINQSTEKIITLKSKSPDQFAQVGNSKKYQPKHQEVIGNAQLCGRGIMRERILGGFTPPRRPPKVQDMPQPVSLKKFRPPVDWTPYTMSDYRKIRSKTYYELGGLGPFNVGREEWVKSRIAYKKRLNYAENVRISNNHTISRSLGGKTPL